MFIQRFFVETELVILRRGAGKHNLNVLHRLVDWTGQLLGAH